MFLVDPDKKIRLTMTYLMYVGRNIDEILRVIDALQLGDARQIATPADWRPGDRETGRPGHHSPVEIDYRGKLDVLEGI